MADLPSVEIIFRQQASTLIERTGEQSVVLLFDTYNETDNTQAYFTELERLSEVNVDDFKKAVKTEDYEKAYRCLQYCFGSAPKKVIVSNLSWSETWEKLSTSGDTNCVVVFLGTVTTEGDNQMPSLMLSDVKSLNENDGYGCMAIYTSNGLELTGARGTHMICIADNSINTYTSSLDGMLLSEKEKLALYAGAVAACGVRRSLTNYTLPLISVVSKGAIADKDVYEKATKAGIITAKMTAGKPRVVTGINTAEVSGTVTGDMQHVEVICTMDMIAKDITDTFVNYYRGAYKNNYDRQLLLISAICGYFRDLASEEVLDPEYANRCEIDIEQQRNAWLDNGKEEAKDWSNDKVKVMSFGRKVFLLAHIKICQSMEDLQMYINLE